MSLSGKWMELEVIMLRRISQMQETSIAYFLSYVESREQKRNLNVVERSVRRSERGKKEVKKVPEGSTEGGYDQSMIYVYMEMSQ
jgi:hypothetical protein